MRKTTCISETGQAIIPQELRKKYDIKAGDEVVWTDTDDGITMKKRTQTSRHELPAQEPTENKDIKATKEFAAYIHIPR